MFTYVTILTRNPILATLDLEIDIDGLSGDNVELGFELSVMETMTAVPQQKFLLDKHPLNTAGQSFSFSKHFDILHVLKMFPDYLLALFFFLSLAFTLFRNVMLLTVRRAWLFNQLCALNSNFCLTSHVTCGQVS